MIRAVVFDLDDTLFPEHQFVLSGFRAIDAWLRDSRGITGFFDKAEGLFHAGVRGTIFNQVLDSLSINYVHSDINDLIRVYREHTPEINLHDDARWAIDYFRQSHKLAIITDGYLVTQKSKIAALDIADIFDVIICTDEFGRANWKPSEMPYRKVMAAVECSGEECVYIADNPLKDFVSAKKLGWETIQIVRTDGQYSQVFPDESHKAEHIITSLYELEQLLQRIK